MKRRNHRKSRDQFDKKNMKKIILENIGEVIGLQWPEWLRMMIMMNYVGTF